jgi:geranylgeranyl reductase family protein
MDVAVVGAGPAGAWTAYELARRGVDVTIFDGSHPREKPCGGGVTGRALALVGDLPRRAGIALTAIRAVRFIDTPHRLAAVVPLDADTLIVASRAAFDGVLLQAALDAGARLCASRVVDVAISASEVRVETRDGTHRADVIVGADGANSLVRRRAATPFRRDQLSIATGFFARGVTSDEVVLEITGDPPGYLWSFPRPDHLAIGVCGQADAAAADSLRASARAWIQATRLAGDAALDAYSWPIPSLCARDLEAMTPAGPRWCLVGDAAGLVDPITREGIFFALASAGWAAEAIVTANGRFAPAYVERVQSDAITELAAAARFKAGFFQPTFTAHLLHALRESAGVRAVMAGLVAGTQSYRTLKWRLLQTFELGLAWRVLRGIVGRRSRAQRA